MGSIMFKGVAPSIFFVSQSGFRWDNTFFAEREREWGEIETPFVGYPMMRGKIVRG